MRFRDYNRVRLYTHGRTPTSFGDEYEIGHLDDLICMAIAAKYGWAAIRLDDTSPDHVRGRLGRDSYVLNVITDFAYEPEWWENNVIVFDHHDPEACVNNCSAHLLMEELVRQGMLREVPSLMDQISAWDVIGPNAVPVADRPDPDRYTAILAAEPNEGFNRKTAEFILTMLERSFSIRQFVNELFESETRLGENARRIHSEILAKREEALAEIISTATVSESPSGVRYATLDKNPAGLLREIFSRLGVDIVIHPNERTPNAVSVVQDSNGRYATTPVRELVEVAPEQVVFTHPGGFLLVAYPPVIVK
jgi:hypothetical protein